MFHLEDRKLLDDFWVVAVISNPVRYESRYNHYFRFKAEMEAAGVNLFTVELQTGERAHQVTAWDNPRNLQLSSLEELWHKENMINLGIARLPKTWKYVAWSDADISFLNPNWAMETVQQLQHYHFVQLFQHAIDMGPNGEVIQHHNGFNYSYISGKPYGKAYSFWHPGFAHACTREAFDMVGGLIDKSILGAADHHMQLSLISRAESSFPGKISSGYAKYILRWQERATRYIKKDIGFVNGTIIHHWHGRKKDRKYVERWDILIDAQYDPETDLKRDWQGVLTLNDYNIKLRDDIRQYFRQRFEDGNEA